VLVDDGSTDGTADAARACQPGARLTVLESGGRGPAHARNVGLAALGTLLVAFCDADDQWATDRLRHDLAAFNSTDDLDILLGRTRFVADDPLLLAPYNFDSVDRTAVIPHLGAATMRARVLDRVGLLDSHMSNYEDYEWFYRARDLGVHIVTHDRTVQTRTLHANSTSHRHPPAAADLLAVIHRSVQRRRVTGLTDAERLDMIGRAR
jgi:glycosyltransferase involved in cell wall biosynthesis